MHEKDECFQVFISYSLYDSHIAEALSNLLCAALTGLGSDDIFCMSIEGSGLPGGAQIGNSLEQKIVDAKVVLAIISSESIASPWVMFEIGARWRQGGFTPLLVPGVEAKELGGPAALLNAVECENVGEIHRLLRDLEKILSRKLRHASSYFSQLRSLKETLETRRSAFSICRAFFHLDSPHYDKIDETVKRHMLIDRELIPTKYLFAHPDSQKHYRKLIKEPSYIIAAHGNALFENQSAEIADYLFARVATNGALNIVSLGIGLGEKEVWLLKKFPNQQKKVLLLAIDQNPVFVISAMCNIKEARAEREIDANISCEFMVGDFDFIAELTALLPSDRPTVFLALGGTFGNQEERKFLDRLRLACKGETYLLMDFDIISKDQESTKSGYATDVNKKFISSMFNTFGEEKPISVEALPASKVFGHTISSLGDENLADVIVMMGRFKYGRRRYFGYSTRYDKAGLIGFLGRSGWEKIKEFNNPEWPKVSIFLCKMKHPNANEYASKEELHDLG